MKQLDEYVRLEMAGRHAEADAAIDKSIEDNAKRLAKKKAKRDARFERFMNHSSSTRKTQ